MSYSEATSMDCKSSDFALWSLDCKGSWVLTKTHKATSRLTGLPLCQDCAEIHMMTQTSIPDTEVKMDLKR